MENYIVSARKYRPSTFDTVVGQRALTTTLKNAIANHKLARPVKERHATNVSHARLSTNSVPTISMSWMRPPTTQSKTSVP